MASERSSEQSGQPMAGVSRYARLDGEEALWQGWRERRDEAARDALVQHYLPYARALAAQLYRRRTHDEFEFDEYMQFATVGLMEAMGRFDPAQGAMFKTYATRRIVGSMQSGIATLSERQQQISLRRRISEERIASLQAETAGDEAPEHLLRELAEIGVGLALGFILEDTGIVFGEDHALPDNTYTRLELRQFQQRIRGMLAELTEREQEVIRMHYLQGVAFDDIASALAVTKGRISQLHKQGLARLRKLIIDTRPCNIFL